jgi:hypothetical protein
MIQALMFSGGVDSIVCLKMLQEQGIIPILFYCESDIYRECHWSKSIKKTAKLLSPKSQLYIFDVKEYKAFITGNGDYGITLKDGTIFYPYKCVDKLIVGFFEKDIDKKHPIKKGNVGMKEAIRVLNKNPKLEFPLRHLARTKIERIWKTLPLEVKKNTLTTSRKPNGIWKAVYDDGTSSVVNS